MMSAKKEALAGFYPLSKTFPATFYISEMVSIIKSTGITSDKANSKADQAFQRWTKGNTYLASYKIEPNWFIIITQKSRPQKKR